MRKIIGWSIQIVSLILGLFFGSIWFNRYRLDYNSDGRYFDKMALVVYDQDKVFVYGLLVLFFLLIGLLCSIITIRKKHSKRY